MRILNPFNSLKKLNISSIALALLLIAMPRIAAADVCFLPTGGCVGEVNGRTIEDAVCDEGTYAQKIVNGVCEQCKNHWWNCSGCVEGYEFVNNKCLAKCPDGKKRAEDGKCYDDCAAFTDANLVNQPGYSCTRCPTDVTKYKCTRIDCGAHGTYNQKQGKCVCDTNYAGDKCQNCASGYEKIDGICKKPSEYCSNKGFVFTSNKSSTDGYTCTQCESGGTKFNYWKCSCLDTFDSSGTGASLLCSCKNGFVENGKCYKNCADAGYKYYKDSGATYSNTVCDSACPIDGKYYKECYCSGGSTTNRFASYNSSDNLGQAMSACYSTKSCRLSRPTASYDVTYYSNTKIRELVDDKCQTCAEAGYTLTAAQKANRVDCSSNPCPLDTSKWKCGNCKSGYQLCNKGTNSGKCMAACSGSTPYWDADTCTCVSEPECVRQGYTFFEDNATQHNTTCSNACPSDNRYYAECHCSDGSVNSPWGGHTGTSNLSATMSACYTTTSCTLKGEIKYKNTVKRALVDGQCQTCAEAGYTLTAAQKANRSGCSQCAIDTSKWKCSGGCNSNYQLCSSTNTCVACNANMWNASSCTCNTCEGLGYTLTATQAANRSGCSTCPSDSSKYKCTGGCASGYTLCSAQNKCVPACDSKHYLDKTCTCICNGEFSLQGDASWNCYTDKQRCTDKSGGECEEWGCTLPEEGALKKYTYEKGYTATRNRDGATVWTAGGKKIQESYGWTCILDGTETCIASNPPSYYNCTCAEPKHQCNTGTNKGKCIAACGTDQTWDANTCTCVDNCTFTFSDGSTAKTYNADSGSEETSRYTIISKKGGTSIPFTATTNMSWITTNENQYISVGKYYYMADIDENTTSSARTGTITLQQTRSCNKTLTLTINQEAGNGCTFTIDGGTYKTYNAGSGSEETNGYTIVSKKDGTTIPYTATANVSWIDANYNISNTSYTADIDANYTSSARSGTITLKQVGCSGSGTIIVNQAAGSCPYGYSNTVTSTTCAGEGRNYTSRSTLDGKACGKCEGCVSGYNMCNVATAGNYNKCIKCEDGEKWNANTCECEIEDMDEYCKDIGYEWYEEENDACVSERKIVIGHAFYVTKDSNVTNNLGVDNPIIYSEIASDTNPDYFEVDYYPELSYDVATNSDGVTDENTHACFSGEDHYTNYRGHCLYSGPQGASNLCYCYIPLTHATASTIMNEYQMFPKTTEWKNYQDALVPWGNLTYRLIGGYGCKSSYGNGGCYSWNYVMPKPYRLRAEMQNWQYPNVSLYTVDAYKDVTNKFMDQRFFSGSTFNYRTYKYPDNFRLYNKGVFQPVIYIGSSFYKPVTLKDSSGKYLSYSVPAGVSGRTGGETLDGFYRCYSLFDVNGTWFGEDPQGRCVYEAKSTTSQELYGTPALIDRLTIVMKVENL